MRLLFFVGSELFLPENLVLFIGLLFRPRRAMNVSRPGKARIAAPEPPPRAGKTAGHKGGSPVKNQTFGIEIETTGLGRERAAKAIAAHFGTTARYIGHHLDDWRVPIARRAALDGRARRLGQRPLRRGGQPGVRLGGHRDGPGGGPRPAQGGREGRRLLRHPHPRGPRPAHPGEPAAAGQSGQRQGGPADTGRWASRPSGAPAGASRWNRCSSPSSTAASPTPWRRWHSFGTTPTTAGTRTGGGTPLPTTT